MQILRPGKNNLNWNAKTNYKSSFYNIIEKGKKNIAIYNTASGAVAIIEKNIFNKKIASDIEKKLVQNGFLVPQDLDEFENYYSKIKFNSKQNTDFFTIIPTTACNARCFYCYEEGYCKKSINKSSHRRIVNYLAKKIKNKNKFVLDWYGGEPLVCIKEIDRIIEDLSQEIDLSKKQWTSSITTNATLFDEKTINHAIEKWHLSIAHITIDGTEKEHNYRKRVTLKEGSAFNLTKNAILNLLKAGVYVNLRVHLDNKNKESFPQILQSIEEFFEYANFHLFPTYLFPPEFEIPDNYIKESEKEELFYNVFKALSNLKYKEKSIDFFPWPKTQNCFATKENTIVIGPDGTLHSCVQEFTNNDKENNKKFENYSMYCKKCKKCNYFPLCLGGCIHNHSLKGTVRTPCVRNKYIIRPLLTLILESIENNTVTSSENNSML